MTKPGQPNYRACPDARSRSPASSLALAAQVGQPPLVAEGEPQAYPSQTVSERRERLGGSVRICRGQGTALKPHAPSRHVCDVSAEAPCGAEFHKPFPRKRASAARQRRNVLCLPAGSAPSCSARCWRPTVVPEPTWPPTSPSCGRPPSPPPDPSGWASWRPARCRWPTRTPSRSPRTGGMSTSGRSTGCWPGRPRSTCRRDRPGLSFPPGRRLHCQAAKDAESSS